MPDVPVRCPHCHERFAVASEEAGHRVHCPKCQAFVKVPTAAAAIYVHHPAQPGQRGSLIAFWVVVGLVVGLPLLWLVINMLIFHSG